MNEIDVKKGNLTILIIGSIIFTLVSIILKDISYLLGFILGFLINALVFEVIIKTTDYILEMNQSTALIVILQIVKLLLYATGFILAVKTPLFHIISVFAGYMITRLSIFMEGYKRR